ncbi:hypothetical protein BHF71_03765 [Vulcanibacillus modesticaldus]|uniref:Uncharacterized protein n=1 Tax=Vulcanibacillus modesticaldus TaxID=337097 RepID=A0A1D2YSG5_9BACI|nr:hypothetical protein [Vulcanibacillus modesticaldus]OEF97262.1 hypothetical protein BHF71_03765 [Vulcanibacillus modesticaldus]
MGYQTISIIGLSKNAGKTTLLNHLIKKYQREMIKIGITTIGVDGEQEDGWTGNKKPAILVPEGTIIATVSDGLKIGTARWRILEKLNLHSSIGDIYLAEAIQEGTVKLLGIPSTEDISHLSSRFEDFGTKRLLVDGAYDRLSSANPLITDSTYLVIGASLHRQELIFWKKVEEKIRPFFYDKVKDEKILTLIQSWEKEQKIIIMQGDKIKTFPAAYLFTNDIIEELEWMLLPGVLTDRLLMKMIQEKKIFNIVLQNGLKSFVSSTLEEKWQRLGGSIQVVNSIKINGIAYNPYSPEGYSFSSKLMEEKIEQIVQKYTKETIPIFDVWRDKLKVH